MPDHFSSLSTEIRWDGRVSNKGCKSNFHFASLQVELLFDSQRAKLVITESSPLFGAKCRNRHKQRHKSALLECKA